MRAPGSKRESQSGRSKVSMESRNAKRSDSFIVTEADIAGGTARKLFSYPSMPGDGSTHPSGCNLLTIPVTTVTEDLYFYRRCPCMLSFDFSQDPPRLTHPETELLPARKNYCCAEG